MFGWIGILAGIIILLLGIFLVFFFPNVTEHQPESMSWTGIVMGFVFIVIGGMLIFV